MRQRVKRNTFLRQYSSHERGFSFGLLHSFQIWVKSWMKHGVHVHERSGSTEPLLLVLCKALLIDDGNSTGCIAWYIGHLTSLPSYYLELFILWWRHVLSIVLTRIHALVPDIHVLQSVISSTPEGRKTSVSQALDKRAYVTSYWLNDSLTIWCTRKLIPRSWCTKRVGVGCAWHPFPVGYAIHPFHEWWPI